MIHPPTIALSLLLASSATANEPRYVMPQIPTEEEKTMALKLGYILNGDSMARWGSIDLSGPKPLPAPEPAPVAPLTTKQPKGKQP